MKNFLKNSPEVILLNFSHVYEMEPFSNWHEVKTIDFTDLSGTSCYCDADALQKIEQRLRPYSPYGIHFIDSGNYHYVSKIWTDKIDEPFSLIVFDHHPDMQPSLFESMLSCGSWVKEVLDTNQFLRHVIIIGAAENLIAHVSSAYGLRVNFFGEQQLKNRQTWQEFSLENVSEPVYISVDKDVLDTAWAQTNWDQGSLSLKGLEQLLDIIIQHESVIGVDVCGEFSNSLDWLEQYRAAKVDCAANAGLLHFLEQKMIKP